MNSFRKPFNILECIIFYDHFEFIFYSNCYYYYYCYYYFKLFAIRIDHNPLLNFVKVQKRVKCEDI